jgi:ABC-type phosphate transport system auxiliary subunit
MFMEITKPNTKQMRKTFQFKLYRSKRNKHLQRQIDVASEIYNHCIALHKRHYRLFGKSVNKYRLQKHLTQLKNALGLGVRQNSMLRMKSITDFNDEVIKWCR